MASKVDICNLALSHIGQKANISSIDPPDPTVEAQDAARFYPMALNETLEAHAWGFAMTRRVLVEVADVAPASWQYAYQWPNQCLRPVAVLEEEADDDDPTEKWIREGDYIYTNVENATLRYVQLVTDTNKFSPSFTISLSHRLAAYLAGKIIKGKAGEDVRDKQLKLAEAVFGRAASLDANSERTNTYRDHEASSVAARR